MAKDAATTKQTGGGGYSYGDKVAARYMAMMLAGQTPLGERVGTIHQIKFENKTDGWLLDDLLLLVSGEDGDSRFALSVKSNQQITSNGFPDDFVSAVWKQWLHKESNVFNRSRDHLGLVVGPLPQNVRTGWHGLLEKTINADPASVLTRLNTSGSANDVERQLFQSLSCKLPGEAVTNEETVLVVKRLRVFDLDSKSTPSQNEQEAVSICQGTLSSGLRNEAADLWDRLQRIARDFTPTGGSLSLEKLLDLLRPGFRLKEYPEYASDFEKLSGFSAELIDQVPDRIGGAVSIDRSTEIEEIVLALEEHRCVALIGTSGAGKSAMGKGVALRARQEAKLVVWFDYQTLDEPTLADVEGRIRIHFPLRRLLCHVAASSALLILDGIDRFSPNAVRNAAQIIKYLQLENTATPWMLLASCQHEEWERVARDFLKHGTPLSIFSPTVAAFPTDERLESVWSSIPSLATLSLRTDLRPLFRNLKILDIVASNAIAAGNIDTAKWVGESDMVRWFWDDVVVKGQSGHARSRLLQKLGEHEAEHLRPFIAITDLEDSEARTLGDLIDSRICRVRDEQVTFEHDLFGDWSRQRMLLGQSARLREFLADRIARPRWLRAVRLYGLHLLEQGRGSLSGWREAMEKVRSSAEQYGLANDLLLESVIFAANPIPILEAMWEDLAASEGDLLRRLLRRFLHVATLPNPQLMTMTTEDRPDENTHLATMYRVPYWPYWLPMLVFLLKRAEGVATLVPVESALITNKWLRMSQGNGPFRRLAASLALRVAQKYVDENQRRRYRRRDEESDAIYTALLAASIELPEAVTPVVLGLCGRTADEGGDNEEPSSEHERGGDILGPAWDLVGSTSPQPWPDGPRERVNKAFQQICLEHEALVPLIQTRPTVAREVFLALLIEHRRAKPYGHWDFIGDSLGTEHLHAWYPSIFFRGCFRAFLTLHPEHGLDAIIRLVNFAADRWAERFEWHDQRVPTVKVLLESGEHELIGDNEVYYWYRDRLIRSQSVPSALMALEWWLYEKIKQNEAVDEWVRLVLDRSRTVAPAAVLCAVGRRYPDLFAGPLKPLLAVWQFYHWEYLYTARREEKKHLTLMLAPWSRYSESVFNIVRDWHTLPHRNQCLPEVALELLRTRSALRPLFEEIRVRWETELAALRSADAERDCAYLENIIAEIDIQKYPVKEPPKGTSIEFIPPDDIREKSEPVLERRRRQLHLLAFPFRCRQLVNRGDKLGPDQIQEFWDEFSQILGIFEREESDSGFHQLEDIVCGGIAVLKCLQSDWLKAHPERQAWCDAWLERIKSEPPAKDPIVFEHSVFDQHWDSFLANIAVSDWAVRPEDTKTRELVAAMGTTLRYETVGILMRSATRFRHRFGEDFERLQSFLILWAGVRNIWNYSCRFEKGWVGTKRWIDRLVEAFVEGKLPVRVSSWARVGKASNLQIARMYFRRSAVKDPGERPTLSEQFGWISQKPGLDLQLLLHSFRWIPALSEASSEQERSGWIHLWRQALNVTLRHALTAEDDRWGSNHLPDDFDRWVFGRIPQIILQSRSEDESASFWLPILDLGPECHDWIEDFLTSWFMDGIRGSDSVAEFTAIWTRMIKHALVSPNWQSSSGVSSFDLNRMWIELLALGWGVSVVKGEEFRSAITSMIPLYREWASCWLGYHDNPGNFAYFLRQPSAAELLPEGLIWVFDLARTYSDEDWEDRPKDADAFVTLVEHWWRTGQGSASSNQETTTAIGLLKLIADQLHPRALELQDQIAKAR